ncbi:MAG: pro-sigmaK processing inhibitor BofA family protein [Oscillospiraceae bacterium]|nr:pro-sigmaK processing inhibitor BofA family protein [Oscillospiraceae bacterium]
MEEIVLLLIPAMLAVVLIRILLLPIRLLLKLGIHSACGLICLWLLNGVSVFTGIAFPINAATVLIAGFLGLPGIGGMALLAVLG